MAHFGDVQDPNIDEHAWVYEPQLPRQDAFCADRLSGVLDCFSVRSPVSKRIS